jgi:hypothetical protein
MNRSVIILFFAFVFSSCANADIGGESIASGIGEFSIKNDSYLYYSHYQNFREKSIRSKHTYIRIEGVINIDPKRTYLERSESPASFAKLEVTAINGKKFNPHVLGYNMSPGGIVTLNKDSTVSYSISIEKKHFEHWQAKTLPSDMKIDGVYNYYGDTITYPFTINAGFSPDKLNIYARYVNKEIEEELGIKVDFAIVKGLILEHHLYFNSDLPQILSKFKSVQNLYIREFKIDQPFPEELYKLKSLESLFFHMSLLNSNDEPIDPAQDVFKIPKEIFEISRLKSLRFKTAQRLSFPEIPIGSELERLEIVNHCVFDSIPKSIVNLKQLKSLRLMGEINAPLPANLNQLTLLDSLIIPLPNGVIPENFGPWENLSYVSIFYPYNYTVDFAEYRARKKRNLPILLELFSNVADVRVGGVRF